METQFSKNKTELDLFKLKYAKSQAKEKLLTEKFKALDGLVQFKIEQNTSKWSEMI